MKRSKAIELKKAEQKGFRKGVLAAAHIANGYNALNLHKFRLGDCIERQLKVTSRKEPRKNVRTMGTIRACQKALSNVKLTDELLMQTARILDPTSWAEYARNKGRVTNATGWRCLETLEMAKNLLKAGYRDCGPRRSPLPKALRKRPNWHKKSDSER
jgi:hypothetical protein